MGFTRWVPVALCAGSQGHSHRSVLLIIAMAIFACGTLTGTKPPTVIVPDSKTDAVQVRILFGAGSACDPPGKEGLAYFTASALMSRASSLPSGEIDVAVDRDVAIIDGHCPAADWPAFSQLLTSVLTRPAFDSLDIQHVIEVQLATLDSLRASDLAIAQAALQYYLYRDHPYGHPPVGLEHTIRTLTVADAREFWRTHYTNGNYMLGLAGNVPASAANKIHAALRAALDKGKPAAPSLPEPLPAGLSVYAIEKPGCDRSTVLIGRPIGAVRGDSTFLPLVLVAAHLAGRDASKGGLDQLLQVDRGLVDSVFGTVEHNTPSLEGDPVDQFLPRRQEYFMTGTLTKTVNAAFVLNIIMRELDDLSEHGLSQAELDSARAYASRWGPLTERRPCEDRMATRLRDLWLGTEGSSERSHDDAAGATTTSVRRLIAPLLNPRTMTVIAVVPDGQAFATQLLSGPLTCEYPDSVDRRRIRAEDQRFMSYRPPWEVQKMRIVKAVEMFR